MAIPLIKQILNRIVGLENTNLNLNNKISELMNREEFKIYNIPNISFDDLMLKGENSISKISNNSAKLAGFPSGAYDYGLLITLNPTHSTTNTYSTTQIYITDVPTGASGGNGIYIRTRVGGTWCKITGIAVSPVS